MPDLILESLERGRNSKKWTSKGIITEQIECIYRSDCWNQANGRFTFEWAHVRYHFWKSM